MINNSFTSNVRDANGGDISVKSFSQPFKQSDLSFFDNLKSQGTIANYTAVINSNGSTGVATSPTNSFSVIVVDPSTFPLVTPPTFSNLSNGSLSSSLTNDQVAIDQNLADQYNKKVGDSNFPNDQWIITPVSECSHLHHGRGLCSQRLHNPRPSHTSVCSA